MISTLHQLHPSVKQHFINQFEALVSPLREMGNSLHQVSLQVLQREGGLYTDLIQAIFRMHELEISCESQRKMCRIYSRYLDTRGTLEGLKILSATLLPDIDIEIDEREFPFEPLCIDARIEDQRLITKSEFSLSLTLRFSVSSQLCHTQSYRDYMTLVTDGMPPATRVYCLFNDEKASHLPRIGEYRL